MLGARTSSSALSAQREQYAVLISSEIFACYARVADVDVRASSINQLFQPQI